MSFFDSEVVRAEMTEIQELQEEVYSSVDPDAIMMKTRIVESATMMGLPKDVEISVIFSNMGKMLDAMKKQIDTQGFDV